MDGEGRRRACPDAAPGAGARRARPRRTSQRRRWESNPLAPGCSRLPGRLAPASALSPPGVEPGPRPSQGRVQSTTPRGSNTPPRNRTSPRGFERRRAVRHTRGANHYPDLESNQDLDLRRVPCRPLHHRDYQSRRLDSHQHEAVYGTAAFLRRATPAVRQERKDSNPVPRRWRPRALPGARSCPGCPGGIEPAASTLTTSRAGRYTTDTTRRCSPPPGAPTRIRTRNPRVETWDDVRFTTGASSGRRGSRTLISIARTA